MVSKTACVKGEQLLFRVLLYTRNRIEAVNMISSASFAGFWQEWFPVPQSITPGSENVNGVIYQVYEIRKAALFASESGTLAIPPLQFELQLADPSSGFFGAQALRRSTQAVQVNVSEPPAAGRGIAGRAIQLCAGLPAPGSRYQRNRHPAHAHQRQRQHQGHHAAAAAGRRSRRGLPGEDHA